jgi:hypothetical protein
LHYERFIETDVDQLQNTYKREGYNYTKQTGTVFLFVVTVTYINFPDHI